MLLNCFYDILLFADSVIADGEQLIKATIRFHESHSIFKGHFPGNPVVPGVCQVQIIKELAEKSLNHSVRLYESNNIKFLSMINPQANPEAEIEMRLKRIAPSQFSAVATMGFGSTIFLKFNGKFELEEQCQKKQL